MGKRKFKMRREVSAGGVVIHPSGRSVLLVKSRVGRGGWGLPKGHIRRRESPIEAARREIFEETGLQKKSLRLLGPLSTVRQLINYARSRESVERETMFFLFLSKSDVVSSQHDDDAHDEVKWVPWRDMRRLNLRYKYVSDVLLHGRSTFETLRTRS